MTKSINNYIIMAVLLMGIAGCASMDMDPSVDFSRYRTFAWGKAEVDVKNPVHDSDLINKRIKNTVAKEFAKRGIVLDKKNPDFLVSYHTYTEQKEKQDAGAPYYGYPFYPFRFYPFGYAWAWGPYGWGMPPRTYTYTEGTLIIDITDKKTNELLWRGTVSGNVNNTASLQKQIEKGIRAIMKKYPVDPKAPLPVEGDVV